jgi:uncharacterized protein YndB with AHSA1/START domain
MNVNAITVKVTIAFPIEMVWDYYTAPNHIQQWNQASPDWHCPSATNELEVGKKFSFTMAAKDGSFSFDFWGTYTTIETNSKLYSTLGDGRELQCLFESIDDNTTQLTQIFEPETENTIELQQQGWQSILISFKNYVEQQ